MDEERGSRREQIYAKLCEWMDLSAEPYDRFDEKWHYYEGTTRALIEKMDLKPGMKVLDLACGPGTSTFPIARKVAPKGSVIGVDSSSGMIQLAKRKAQRLNIRNAKFLIRNALDITEFVKPGFDAVVCNCAIWGFPDLPKVLYNVNQILRKYGVFGFTVSASPQKEGEKRFQQNLDDDIRKVAIQEGITIPSFVRSEPRPRKYEELLADADFSLVSVDSERYLRTLDFFIDFYKIPIMAMTRVFAGSINEASKILERALKMTFTEHSEEDSAETIMYYVAVKK